MLIYLFSTSLLLHLVLWLKFNLPHEWNIPQVKILGQAEGLNFNTSVDKGVKPSLFTMVCQRFLVPILLVCNAFGTLLPFLIIGVGNFSLTITSYRLKFFAK